MYPELPRVTCQELKQLMDEGVDLTLVDTGGGGHFRMGHIKGASNIPSDPLPPYTEEWVENKLTMLPSDKLTIFYCD